MGDHLRPEETPDSRRFARRLASVIYGDLTDRAPGVGFYSEHVSVTFDAEAGMNIFQIECGAVDGSRAMVTVHPLPPGNWKTAREVAETLKAP